METATPRKQAAPRSDAKARPKDAAWYDPDSVAFVDVARQRWEPARLVVALPEPDAGRTIVDWS